MVERLSKFLSRSGIASRRKSGDIITSGRVAINGVVVTSPSQLVYPQRDTVMLDGHPITPSKHPLYIALYKPVGYISDLSDPRGRRIARDLISIDASLFPVGRLDYNSEGLLLFTNDGAFANLVMHPRYETEKEYLVKLRGKLTHQDIALATKGVTISGDLYRVARIAPLRETATNSWYTVIVAEGKNRMIRKLMDAIRHPVLKLKRVRIDGILLGGLRPGQYRHIEKKALKPIFDRQQISSRPLQP